MGSGLIFLMSKWVRVKMAGLPNRDENPFSLPGAISPPDGMAAGIDVRAFFNALGATGSMAGLGRPCVRRATLNDALGGGFLPRALSGGILIKPWKGDLKRSLFLF